MDIEALQRGPNETISESVCERRKKPNCSLWLKGMNGGFTEACQRENSKLPIGKRDNAAVTVKSRSRCSKNFLPLVGLCTMQVSVQLQNGSPTHKGAQRWPRLCP